MKKFALLLWASLFSSHAMADDAMADDAMADDMSASIMKACEGMPDMTVMEALEAAM